MFLVLPEAGINVCGTVWFFTGYIPCINEADVFANRIIEGEIKSSVWKTTLLTIGQLSRPRHTFKSYLCRHSLPTFVLFSTAHFICYWIFFWLTIAAIFIAYDPLGKSIISFLSSCRAQSLVRLSPRKRRKKISDAERRQQREHHERVYVQKSCETVAQAVPVCFLLRQKKRIR